MWAAGAAVLAAVVLLVVFPRGSKSPADGPATAGGPGAMGPGGMGGGGRGRGPAPTVAVAAAVQADVPVFVDALGTVQAFNAVTVRTRVDGQLIKVNFQEGQEVKAGDLLAQVDPRLYQAQLDQAVAKQAQDKAALANARLDLERYRELASEKYGTQQQYDTQRAQVAQLEATLKADAAAIETARTNLSYATITAPIGGRVGLRQVDVGNIIHAGDANGIVSITQMQPISVVFNVPQQRLPEINRRLAGGTRMMTLATGSDGKEIARGELATLDNQIDATTGTIKLKASFPNPDLALWPGGFVNVRLLIDVRHDSLVVPSAAIQHGPAGTYVYVVGDDHTVEQRPVAVAVTEGEKTALASGVAAGETVVVNGQDRLQPGAKVTIAPERPPEAGAPGTAQANEAAAERPAQPGPDGQHRRRRRDGAEGAPAGGAGQGRPPAGRPPAAAAAP
jgi:multidrug efflux system membrane fusion protein